MSSLQTKIKQIENEIYRLRNYLEKARMVAAEYSIAAPIHLLIEIEDREATIKEYERKLKELKKLSDEEFERIESKRQQQKTIIKKSTEELTEDEKITLKEMLADLIFDYLVEAEDIEVSFNPKHKVYRVLLKRFGEQE